MMIKTLGKSCLLEDRSLCPEQPDQPTEASRTSLESKTCTNRKREEDPLFALASDIIRASINPDCKSGTLFWDQSPSRRVTNEFRMALPCHALGVKAWDACSGLPGLQQKGSRCLPLARRLEHLSCPVIFVLVIRGSCVDRQTSLQDSSRGVRDTP